jgi:hypothetical protein
MSTLLSHLSLLLSLEDRGTLRANVWIEEHFCCSFRFISLFRSLINLTGRGLCLIVSVAVFDRPTYSHVTERRLAAVLHNNAYLCTIPPYNLVVAMLEKTQKMKAPPDSDLEDIIAQKELI